MDIPGVSTNPDAVEAMMESIIALKPLLEKIKEKGRMNRITLTITLDLTNGQSVFETRFNVWDEQNRTGEGWLQAHERR